MVCVARPLTVHRLDYRRRLRIYVTRNERSGNRVTVCTSRSIVRVRHLISARRRNLGATIALRRQRRLFAVCVRRSAYRNVVQRQFRVATLSEAVILYHLLRHLISIFVGKRDLALGLRSTVLCLRVNDSSRLQEVNVLEDARNG